MDNSMSESANKEEVYSSYSKKIIHETPYFESAFLSIGDSSFYSLKPVNESGISITTCYGSGAIHQTRHEFLSIQQPVLFSHLMYQKNREIALLNRKIGEMKNRIELLEQKIGSVPEITVENFVEISNDQMKEKIFEYHKEHKIVDPEKFADEFNFDLMDVLEAISQLINEGLIEEVD